jgi:hypothetical protein
VYLARLLFEGKQVVDASLRVALMLLLAIFEFLDLFTRTALSFSASGMAASVSLEKSLSAFSTSPLDMVAGQQCIGDVVRWMCSGGYGGSGEE